LIFKGFFLYNYISDSYCIYNIINHDLEIILLKKNSDGQTNFFYYMSQLKRRGDSVKITLDFTTMATLMKQLTKKIIIVQTSV